ncbi:hypothetical protein GCM10009759_59710 [Kitasatospora saccharophila]|uniref:Uncharacterized protein n=1 Tax=Kitasatospora saccharophila TaxID=407973 RepID=A0ABN2XP55_9ACTN
MLALRPPGRYGPDGNEFTQRVTALLVGRYGAWACGWWWAVGEGGSAGPVQSWCCAWHSLRPGPEAAARAVVAALLEWREWLELSAERFAELAPPPGATEEDRSWAVQRASSRLVTVVVSATMAQCGWHKLARRTLAWYLDSTGVPEERAVGLVERAIGGRFASWTAPGFSLVDAVGEDLAFGVTGHRPYRDH